MAWKNLTLKDKIKAATAGIALAGFLGGLSAVGIIDYKAEEHLTPEAKAAMELESELQKFPAKTYAFNELGVHQKAVENYGQMQMCLENKMAIPEVKASIDEYNECKSKERLPGTIAGFCGIYGFALGMAEVFSERKKRKLAAKKE